MILTLNASSVLKEGILHGVMCQSLGGKVSCPGYSQDQHSLSLYDTISCNVCCLKYNNIQYFINNKLFLWEMDI